MMLVFNEEQRNLSELENILELIFQHKFKTCTYGAWKNKKITFSWSEDDLVVKNS